MSSPADELHALLDERDAEIARRLRAALVELFSWVENWSPPFTDDDDWPDTEAKVRAALDRAREGVDCSADYLLGLLS